MVRKFNLVHRKAGASRYFDPAPLLLLIFHKTCDDYFLYKKKKRCIYMHYMPALLSLETTIVAVANTHTFK